MAELLPGGLEAWELLRIPGNRRALVCSPGMDLG